MSLTARELRLALDESPDGIAALVIPSPAWAREAGLTPAHLLAHRRSVLLDVGSAVTELRARGLALRVRTIVCDDISPLAERVVVIEREAA